LFTDFKKQKVIKNKYLSKTLFFSKKTLQRKIKRGTHRRNEIISNISPKAWCQIPVKKIYSKITPLIKNALKDWIIILVHVKQSAFARDTI
jgi:hypothetical protein